MCTDPQQFEVIWKIHTWGNHPPMTRVFLWLISVGHGKWHWSFCASEECSHYGFSSNHVWMWKLNHKEGWARRIDAFETVLLEKTLESPLDRKEIKPVNLKGNKPWLLIGRTDTEAETPILWPPNANSWLIGNNLDARKDWGQEEKEVTWHD